MTNLLASGIMMSSQLGNETIGGAKRNNCHDSWSDLVVDIFRGLPCRIWSACMAVAQAPCALPDARASRTKIAWHDVWSCPPGILAMGRARPGPVIELVVRWGVR